MAVVFAVVVSLFSIAALTRNDGGGKKLTTKQFLGNAATRTGNIFKNTFLIKTQSFAYFSSGIASPKASL